jgi:hypothetical protein
LSIFLAGCETVLLNDATVVNDHVPLTFGASHVKTQRTPIQVCLRAGNTKATLAQLRRVRADVRHGNSRSVKMSMSLIVDV